jgi:hypothetical protein
MRLVAAAAVAAVFGVVTAGVAAARTAVVCTATTVIVGSCHSGRRSCDGSVDTIVVACLNLYAVFYFYLVLVVRRIVSALSIAVFLLKRAVLLPVLLAILLPVLLADVRYVRNGVIGAILGESHAWNCN